MEGDKGDKSGKCDKREVFFVRYVLGMGKGRLGDPASP